MAITQFPDRIVVRPLDTGEDAKLGRYEWSGTDINELKHIVLSFYKQGTESGSEQFRISAYPFNGNDVAAVATAQTEWADMADAMTGGQYVVGTLQFDFTTPLSLTHPYELRITSQNYTRNADTFYFSYIFDHPHILNTRSTPGETGAQLRFVELNKG